MRAVRLTAALLVAAGLLHPPAVAESEYTGLLCDIPVRDYAAFGYVKQEDENIVVTGGPWYVPAAASVTLTCYVGFYDPNSPEGWTTKVVSSTGTEAGGFAIPVQIPPNYSFLSLCGEATWRYPNGVTGSRYECPFLGTADNVMWILGRLTQ